MRESISSQKIGEDKENVTRSLAEYNKLIHDLRNLLSPMLLHSQMLALYAETAGKDKDAIKKSAEAVEESVKAMVALLDSK